MRKLIAVVALAATAACVDTTMPVEEPLVGNLGGTYALRAFNGAPLPVTLSARDTTVVFDTDSLFLTDAGAWNETVQYRQTVGTNATTNETLNFVGVWSRSANNLSFRVQAGTFYLGRAAVDTLVLSDGQNTYVFTR